jgi:CDGSH-type Zn-finger protein
MRLHWRASVSERIVEVTPNGPLLVSGNVTVKRADGTETKHHKVTAFCRCGASGNKRYCDGTHRKVASPAERPADLHWLKPRHSMSVVCVDTFACGKVSPWRHVRLHARTRRDDETSG